MSTKKCIYFFNLLTQLKETAKKNSYLSHYIFSRRSDNKKKKNPEDIFSQQKSTYIYIYIGVGRVFKSQEHWGIFISQCTLFYPFHYENARENMFQQFNILNICMLLTCSKGDNNSSVNNCMHYIFDHLGNVPSFM